ncbi:short-chain dehydrogenase [Francisella halioticida]|uniref:Short-chain dehydrogenase n=1 Tax=Francisella halioticida TaxID=549298 RepID=A0ABM6LZD8_9GAMM|nr:SDR family oxidoreductase [Francisella halioticida]ASG67994.1 short-chain dehydrogenase [Francisella halioticida]BCD90459.1 short-chain dehydrogenase [Francisella halioticida]
MPNYLITGGSNGIGKALIDILKQDKNNDIFNVDISKPNDNSCAKFIKADLTKEQDIQEVLTCIKDISFAGIFLNAGILIKGSIFDIDINIIKKVFNVNIWSNIYLIKGLKENICRGASIVFNGSDQCFVAKSNSFAYTTSKGAIAQMTKSLAIDLAKYDIRVNTVCPGTVDTDFYKNLIQKYAQNEGISFEQAHESEEKEFPLQRIAQPEEVANLVYFLLSDKSKFMTGGLIPIDGGYTAQ